MSYLVFYSKSLLPILATFATNLSYSVFLKTSFVTTLLNLLTSSGRGFNLSMPNLSTSVFKLAKFFFDAKLKVSTCERFLISVFVA